MVIIHCCRLIFGGFVSGLRVLPEILRYATLLGGI
jgi:hypothetical protein